jgi:hypothetical protein
MLIYCVYCILLTDSSAINPGRPIDVLYLFWYCRAISEQSEQQIDMKPASRKQLKAAIQSKGIEGALLVPKGTLTKKQRAFAEAIAAGETGAAAYRMSYNTQASPHSQSNDATRLKRHPVISQQIEALRLANEAMKYADAASIRQLVIQSLIQTVIDPDVKHATKVQAAKVLGSVTEIAAFTERREVTHVKDSGEIRSQILDQLKTMMLGSSDATDVDADSLLAEITGNDSIESDNENRQDDNPTLSGGCQFDNGTPPSTLHSNPHEASQHFFEGSPIPLQTPATTPLSLETQTPGGDIFDGNDEVAK